MKRREETGGNSGKSDSFCFPIISQCCFRVDMHETRDCRITFPGKEFSSNTGRLPLTVGLEQHKMRKEILLDTVGTAV